MEMKKISGKELKEIIGEKNYDVDSVPLDEHEGEVYCVSFEGKYFYTAEDLDDGEIEDNITFYVSDWPLKEYKLKEFFSEIGEYEFYCYDCWRDDLCICDCKDCVREREEKGGNLQIVDYDDRVVLYTTRKKLRDNEEEGYICVFLDKDYEHFVLYDKEEKKYYTNYEECVYAYECKEDYIAELIGEFCDKEVWENPNSPFYFLKKKIEDYIAYEKWRG